MVKIRYSDEFVCPKCGRHTALVCHTDGTHQAHCMICNAYYDVDIAKPTNADRIRAMTDEELAELCKSPLFFNKPWCCLHENPCRHLDSKEFKCAECLLNWLKQEGET